MLTSNVLFQSCGWTVWVQRLRINGRATNLGLGSFPGDGTGHRTRAGAGQPPQDRPGHDSRITESATPTLADALEAVIEGRSAPWKNEGRSAVIWRDSVRNHAADLIHRPVDQIDTGDVLRVIGPLWTDRHDTAKKVRQRLSLAFGWPPDTVPTIPSARRSWLHCPATGSPAATWLHCRRTRCPPRSRPSMPQPPTRPRSSPCGCRL